MTQGTTAVRRTPAETRPAAVAAAPALLARALRLPDLGDALVGAWGDLERCAIEPNAYLSPRFVLPALRHLDPGLAPVILAVSGPDGALAALGVFRARRASRHFPLPHLEAYRSKHSYLSGLLLHRDHAREASGALLAWLGSSRWHGLVFPHFARGLVHGLLVDEAARLGGRWLEFACRERAVLEMAEAGESYVASRFSSQRRKKLRRYWRQLEELGRAEWRLERDGADARAERFMQLEHLGWKGAEGSSLLSSPAEAAFFREMTQAFAVERQSFFTEICLDSQVIASTSNLLSAGEGFAFKVGWDPRYAAMSVGVLNEVELIQRGPALLPGVTRIDSGAEPGSYIDELWAGRRVLVDGVLTTTRAGLAAGRLAAGAVALKRAVVRALERQRSAPQPAASEPPPA